MTYRLGKNLVGAFYNPKAVIVDLELLNSIPTPLLQDSCGELIKYGVLSGHELFNKNLFGEKPCAGHRCIAQTRAHSSVH